MPSFKAAVMRVPVLVPPNVDALPDVRKHNADAMVEAIESTMRGADKARVIVFPVLQYVSSQRGASGIPDRRGCGRLRGRALG